MIPLISVLLPVYNAAATLKDCLLSVSRQTYQHFEIIVIDDGSTDDTARILRQFAAHDGRFRLYRQTHHGIVAALNHGLQHCQGEFIARIDADDRMLHSRLEEQLSFSRQYPDIDLIGCQFRLFRDDASLSSAQLRYQQWSNGLLDDAQIQQGLWLEASIAHPTFFARKNLFEALQGYREQIWAEDYDFLLRARQLGKRFAKVPGILLEKRDSATRLYRTDPRCKRPAMLAAKAHFFARDYAMRDTKQLYLAGSGGNARTIARALQAEGIRISGFIDNVCGPPDRTVMGIPCWPRSHDKTQALLDNKRRNFFILCIGDPDGRAEQEACFHTAGLQSGQHYLRFL